MAQFDSSYRMKETMERAPLEVKGKICLLPEKKWFLQQHRGNLRKVYLMSLLAVFGVLGLQLIALILKEYSI